MEGFEKSMLEACKEADIAVTATGNKDIITGAHFEVLKDRLSFVTLATLTTKLMLLGLTTTTDLLKKKSAISRQVHC